MFPKSVVVSALTVLAVVPARADDPSDAAARGAVAAYTKNLRSFESYRCRFVICTGIADSLADLAAGCYCLTAMGEHLTVADGPRLKMQRFGEPPRGRRPEQWLTEEYSFLCDGAIDLHYQGTVMANVSKPDLPLGLNEATPLDMGHYGPWSRQWAPDTMLADPAKYQFSPAAFTVPGGRPAVGAQFVGEFQKMPQTWQFAFDPSRGYLPCRFVNTWKDHQGEPGASETWLLEARDCGGRFFPTKYLTFIHPRAGKPVSFRLYTVLELDPDYQPSRADLSLDLPAGTELFLHHGNRRVWFPLTGNSTVHPDDLPQVVSDLEATIPPPPQTTSFVRTWLAERWGWLAAVGGAAAAVLLTQLALMRRRRARRSDGTV